MTSKTSANNITGIPNNHKVDKPFGNAHCIYDIDTLKCRDDSINNWTSVNYNDNQIKHNFFNTYKNWFCIGCCSSLFNLRALLGF